MKIGIVLAKTPSYSETFFNSKIKGLIHHGYEVVLYVQSNTNDYGLCKVVQAPRLSKHRWFRFFHVAKTLLSLLPYSKRLFRFVKLEKASQRSYDQAFKNIITNAHLLKSKLDWLHFGFATIAVQSENVAQTIGAKMAVSCRGYDVDVYPLKHPRCYEILWKRVDKVHVISNYIKSKVLDLGLHETKPIALITPAIDIDNVGAIVKQSQSKTIDAALSLVTVARLHWIKGVIPTLEALSILKTKGVNFTYKIIGVGEDYEPIMFAIHQLGLESEVALLGQLTHEETLDKVANSNLYIQYSLSEGFCNAVLEAQALGCLCVVSNGGALPENVVDNETGWVVEKNTPKLLAKKIIEVLTLDEAIKQSVINRARDRVEKEFNVKDQIASFVNFYRY